MSTKYLMHKNDNDAGKDVKLWTICGINTEDITHISCPNMKSRYYLPMRYDDVTTALYTEIRPKDKPKKNK